MPRAHQTINKLHTPYIPVLEVPLKSLLNLSTARFFKCVRVILYHQIFLPSIQRVIYWCLVNFFFKILYITCYVSSDKSRLKSVTKKMERTPSDKLKVWSVHKVASYTKVYSRYYVIIFGTLYLTTLCSQRCWILLLLLVKGSLQ